MPELPPSFFDYSRGMTVPVAPSNPSFGSNVSSSGRLTPSAITSKLAADNLPSQICEKGTRGHLLTDAQKESNRIKSTVRAHVEHVFGAQAQMGGHIVRTIGLARAMVKIGMMNLVYNMKRLVQLIRRNRTGASAMT